MTININQLYSPKDVITKNGGIIPMSISGIYAALNTGDIPSVKIKGRLFIPGYYLNSLVTPQE